MRNWEHGTCRPQQGSHVRLAAALGISTFQLVGLLDGEHRGFGSGTSQEDSSGPSASGLLSVSLAEREEADTDRSRRMAFMGGAAALAEMSLPPVLNTTVSPRLEAVDLEHWNHIARAYTLDYDVVPKNRLLSALETELDVLLADIGTSSDEAGRSLHAPLAILLINAAAAMGSLGYPRSRIRTYWAAAEQAAKVVNDPVLVAWVAGVEADRGIHLDSDVPEYTLARAAYALEIATQYPESSMAAAGAKSALIAQSSVYARLGEGTLALRSLHSLEHHYERWAHRSEGGGYLSIDAPPLHQAAGFVHAYNGSLNQATHALDAAAATMPEKAYGFRAIGELLRSLSMVRAHDLGGLAHAQATLEATPPSSRTRVVKTVAHTVVGAIPAKESAHRSKLEYDAFLTSL